MKPSKLSCDAPLVHEWKRVIGDELKIVHDAAMVSMVRDTGDLKHLRVPSSSTVRRKLNIHNNHNNNEDPIRVIMFLGPWSHT
ncbi:unnamed protein product [Amaranthus hypochondriacus]